MRSALFLAFAALATVIGIDAALPLPIRSHCGPAAHRNAWGICAPDRLRYCPPEWRRNRWGICVRNRH